MNKYIKDLCTPATVYLALSVIAFIGMVVQNLEDSNAYFLFNKKYSTSNKIGIFIGKVLYIALNTWLLNVFCKAGYTNVAWFILFLPLISMFFLILGLLSFI